MKRKRTRVYKRAAGMTSVALALIGAASLAAPAASNAASATTPFGSVDVAAQTTGDSVVVAGWAIDPDTTAPIAVAVYVDGVNTSVVTADGSRDDVATVYPAFGATTATRRR